VIRPLHVLAATLCVALMTPATPARAGGFELGENTTKSVARGGTGVALRKDAAAVYFNPALLTGARGLQLLINTNLVQQDVTFQRDPLVTTRGSQTLREEFDPSTNSGGPFPAPFLAVSWDAGVDNLGLGLGVFGPSAYSGLCYGEQSDGGCAPDQSSGARNMLSGSSLLQIYFLASGAWRFDLGPDHHLSVGVSAGAAYQQNALSVYSDSKTPPSAPYQEREEDSALLEISELTDIKPAAILGLSYAYQGLHLGVSYRPPISWEGEGRAEITPPPAFAEIASLTDDGVRVALDQAGSLRAGIGWAGGTHPGFADRPRVEVEGNVVWEDWSRTQNFVVDFDGALDLGFGDPLALNTVYQTKNWKDTYSLRAGASFAALPWLTAHAGGFMETATQEVADTHADFIAWERYAGSLGATFHIGETFDLDLGGTFIASPDRRVTSGNVYQAVPLSQCQGPDYDQSSCERPGQPPGNPQNQGEWSSSAWIASAGLTVYLLD
jgi:long-subunit fatty acid transport protein